MLLLRRVAEAFGARPVDAPRIGKYRVMRRLAEGGMGEIFLARAEKRGGFEKVVVLKRILQHAMADREAVRMFLDEARLMAGFNHPNIVQVYDFGTSGGSHYFTMEYVHGEDVGRIMRAATMAGRQLPLELAIGLIAEAAAGLHYAHEKLGKDGAPLQIVHRDISPSNLLVSYDGAIKLTDFGIAKWAKRETETRHGGIKGKVAYMSPEQCRGDPLDRRSDVFGLGILLFELSTGTRLYQAPSDFGVLDQIVNRDAPPPSTRRSDYPAALEEIVMRALARDRRQRLASARELQLALEELAREARLKISAVARAAEMEALFGHKVGAWREAAQAGRSLGEHLELMARAAASAAPSWSSAGMGAGGPSTASGAAGGLVRTGTLAEAAALEDPTVSMSVDRAERATRARRRVLAVAVTAAVVAGVVGTTVAVRRWAAAERAVAPARVSVSSPPAPAVRPARPAVVVRPIDPPPPPPSPAQEIATANVAPPAARPPAGAAAAPAPAARRAATARKARRRGTELARASGGSARAAAPAGKSGPGKRAAAAATPAASRPPPATPAAPAVRPEARKVWDPDSIYLP